MGGNALKTIKTRRYLASEYDFIQKEVTSRLKAHPIFCHAKVSSVESYSGKISHGDLDLIVSQDNLDHRIWFALDDIFKPQELVRNGPVTSFNVYDFQVDLIFVPDNLFEMSRYYFAFNDLGNLMGRIAYNMGFSFGHEGLSLDIYDSSNPTLYKGKALLTHDPEVAFSFLGFDILRWRQGFCELNDIFEYVGSSVFCYKDFFDLDKRTYKARVRDAKRTTYQLFLQWLVGSNIPQSAPDNYKELAHERALSFFPSFSSTVEEVHRKHKMFQTAQFKLRTLQIEFGLASNIINMIKKEDNWVEKVAIATKDDLLERTQFYLLNPREVLLWTPSLVEEWTGLKGAARQEVFTRFTQQWITKKDWQLWLNHQTRGSLKQEFLLHYPLIVGKTQMNTSTEMLYVP